MTLFETGRLCVKTAGREAGSLCIVLDKAEKDHVLVTGPRVLTGVRKRKCSIAHLEPLPNKLKIKAEASDSEILELLKKEEDVLKKFSLNVPTAEEIKKLEVQRAERVAKKAEAEKIKKSAPAPKYAEKKAEEKNPEHPKITEKPADESKKTEEKKEAVSEKPKVKKAAKPKEAKA